jgi:methionyl-tRNA formyltransferase
MKKLQNLVFFGSGELGLASLKKLEGEFNISLVVTKLKPERHKGPMPVYDYCQENNLNFITPINKQELNDKLLAIAEGGLESEIGIVVDYGIIIPENVVDLFKFGIINSHFSLLPNWRGADPITFPLLAGEKQTGVTFMKIDKGMDTGNLIKSFKIKIDPGENQESLTSKLSKLSDQHLCSIVNDILEQKIDTIKQPSGGITYSRMLHKYEKEVNFNKPASLIERESRAFISWPKLRVKINQIDCIIKKCSIVPNVHNLKPGHINIGESNIEFGCGAGSCLSIDLLQPVGKNVMTISDYIRGYCK